MCRWTEKDAPPVVSKAYGTARYIAMSREHEKESKDFAQRKKDSGHFYPQI